MKEPTLEEIKRIIGQTLGLREIGESDRIVEELGAESADVLNILASIEDRYSIRIKETEAVGTHTALDLYYLLLAKLS